MDSGHEKTEHLLDLTERKIKKLYEQAAKELEEKLQAYTKRHLAKAAEMADKYAEGKITLEQYQAYLKGGFTGEHYKQLLETLSSDLANADKIAMSIVGGYMPEAYAINHNYAMYQLAMGGVDVSGIFTLYDRRTVERLAKEERRLLPVPKVDIPKDKQWNRQHIQTAITQGVLQGESIPKIAKRLRAVTDMDRRAAIRNSRTAMTGAQNAGRVASYREAKNMGIRVMNEWLATHDGRTRKSHLQIEGDRVEIGEKFSNGCEYPGDPDGDPEEVYNCRCTLIPYLPDYDDVDYDNNVSFEEWEEEQTESAIEGKSYYKPIDRDSFVGERFTSEHADAIDARFKELDSIWHAEISDVKTTLQRDQEQYDLHFENYVKHLLSENPRMRRSTATKRALELLGDRPTVADILLGGDMNSESRIMTINTRSAGSFGSLGDDIRSALRRIERAQQRGRPYYRGNVADSFEAAFIHEYGHAVDFTYGVSTHPEFLAFYTSLSSDEIKYGVSEYAATNEKEFIAECFLDSFMGDAQGELSKRFMEILRRIVK